MKNPRLSLRSIARKMELSHSALSLLINGKRQPSPETIQKLSKAIDLSSDLVRTLSIGERRKSKMTFFETKLEEHPECGENDSEHLTWNIDLDQEDWVSFVLRQFCETPQTVFLESKPVISDMSNTWSAHGHSEQGHNVWLLAPPTASWPYSSRFNPKSAFYQFMAGVITINDIDCELRNDEARIKRLSDKFLALGLAAQDDWLKSAGKEDAKSTLIPQSVLISPWRGGFWRLDFALNSFSDVGAKDPHFLPQPGYDLVKDQVMPFHPLRLSCHVLLRWCDHTQRLIAIYGNTARFRDRQGGLRSTSSPFFEWHLNSMLDHLREQQP